MTGMNRLVRKARLIVVVGLTAGSLTFLAAAPAAAVGVRPVDPTGEPASLAPRPLARPGGAPPLPAAGGVGAPQPQPVSRYEFVTAEVTAWSQYFPGWMESWGSKRAGLDRISGGLCEAALRDANGLLQEKIQAIRNANPGKTITVTPVSESDLTVNWRPVEKHYGDPDWSAECTRRVAASVGISDPTPARPPVVIEEREPTPIPPAAP